MAKSPIEKLASLISGAIVDTLNSTDPSQYYRIEAAVKEFKTTDRKVYSMLMNGGCNEFATLFRAIDNAVSGI